MPVMKALSTVPKQSDHMNAKEFRSVLPALGAIKLLAPVRTLLAAAVFVAGAWTTAQAHIWFTNADGSLDFGSAANWRNATNWSLNQLPGAPGAGNAFIGASNGPGTGPYPVTYSGTMTTVGEVQVGTDANPYGNTNIPGGAASLTLNSGAALTVGVNLVVGQGLGLANNSGVITANSNTSLTVKGTRIFLGFYATHNSGLTTGTLSVNGGVVVHTHSTSNILIVGGWDNTSANDYGVGTLNLNSGTINAVAVNVGRAGGQGTVNQAGGSLNLSSYMTVIS